MALIMPDSSPFPSLAGTSPLNTLARPGASASPLANPSRAVPIHTAHLARRPARLAVLATPRVTQAQTLTLILSSPRASLSRDATDSA